MKKLAFLLDKPEREIKKNVERLEASNGFNSEDARLLAENHSSTRHKILSLGLDPEDTIAEELYQALKVKYAADAAKLDKALGVVAESSVSHRLNQSVNLVKKVVQTKEIWVLKNSAAKKMLKAKPPRKLMKQYDYRSVDSLVKRENIYEVFLALPLFESEVWLNNLQKTIQKLPSSEFELRAPEVIAMTNQKLQRIKARPINTNDHIGAVGLWSTAATIKAPVLTLSLLLLDGLEKLVHAEAAGSIAELNPALVWWEQAKHLIADCLGETVTLNYKDLALDHLKGAGFAQRSKKYGQKTFWDELLARYDNQLGRLESEANNMEANVSEVINTIMPKQPARKLAVDYAEAIANEF